MVDCAYRAALQSATHALHRGIDARFDAFDLADRAGLARFLVAHAIAMACCQPHCDRFARAQLGRPAPDYQAMLVRDLALLGIAAADLPRLELAADADAGVFYVIAGSRMGAAVLRQRALAPTPGGTAREACAYLAVGEGPALWRTYRQWLARQSGAGAPGDDSRETELAAIIAAAVATFALFSQAAQCAADWVLPGHRAMPATATGGQGLTNCPWL